MQIAMSDAEPPAHLPDPLKSRAVLIGTASYEHLEDLPSVANNLSDMRAALTDPELWGLSPAHCQVLADPEEPRLVLEAISAAAQAATDALVVYFTGHGLLMGLELFLGLRPSRTGQRHSAVPYDEIRHEVVDATCYNKVVILDCCYSGRALKGHMTDAIELGDLAGIDGTYLMTATTETAIALAPPGERHTAFSGALIDRLVHGVPDGPDLLDMQTLYYNVRNDLVQRARPRPQQRNRNDGARIALARNRARQQHRTRPAHHAAPPAPAPPDWVRSLLSAAPARICAQIADLRRTDRGADVSALLSAVGRRRDPQGVVAVVGELQELGDVASWQAVLEAAASRSPADVCKVVATFRALDQPQPADTVLERAAAVSVDTAAGLAQLLTGAAADLRLVLDAALAAAQGRDLLLDLVGALWAAGLRDDVDGMLQRGTARMSPEQTLQIADELRSVGQDQSAFGLYPAAAALLAEREADTIARLVASMVQAGRSAEAELIVVAAVAARRTAVELAELAMTLSAVGQGQLADQALAQAGRMDADDDILDAVVMLVSAGHEDAALRMSHAAAADRSAARTVALVRALRERGRPLDARTVLLRVGLGLPLPKLIVLAALADEADRRLLVDLVLDRGPEALSELVHHAIINDGAAVLDLLARRLSADGPNGILAALGGLRSRLPPGEGGALLAPAVRGLSAADREAFAVALAGRDPRSVAWTLSGLAVDSSDAFAAVSDAVLRALTIDRLVDLADALQADSGVVTTPITHDLALEVVDTIAGRPAPLSSVALVRLIWAEDPVARRAAWWIADRLTTPETEVTLGGAADAMPHDASRSSQYAWLRAPFRGSATLRKIVGRVGYLLNTMDPADAPAAGGELDPRIVVGIFVYFEQFDGTDLRASGSPVGQLVRGLAKASGHLGTGSVAPSTLRKAFAVHAQRDEERARSAAITICVAGSRRAALPRLLATLPTAVLTECACQVYAGRLPDGSAALFWRTVADLPRASDARVLRNLFGVIAGLLAIGLFLTGAVSVLGNLVGHRDHTPVWMLIVATGLPVLAVSGHLAERTASWRSNHTDMILGLTISTWVISGLAVLVVGLHAAAELITWPVLLGAAGLLAATITTAAISTRLQTRAAENPCRTILERDKRLHPRDLTLREVTP
ncbi:caspase family protein [Dactylosporangium siamense]|uniref:Caspase domain-containing protein n=1 Tax=Dactylosporangium siamense TaxID=685454 RepID=A0A919UAI7_9ACTN|nr:caspase family protein [Dactylosporangium siamense]GIG48564.1 hypothetical protein Dsi01nite_066050 [Dactylosporangium siamense]